MYPKNSNHFIPAFILFALCFLAFPSVSPAQDKEIPYGATKGARDPFVALVTPDGRLLSLEPASSESKIVLEGITYDENGYSYAIINNKILGVGDYILGYAVFKIEKQKVILLKDNKFVEYRLD